MVARTPSWHPRAHIHTISCLVTPLAAPPAHSAKGMPSFHTHCPLSRQYTTQDSPLQSAHHPLPSPHAATVPWLRYWKLRLPFSACFANLGSMKAA
jgi:hypothetical protein